MPAPVTPKACSAGWMARPLQQHPVHGLKPGAQRATPSKCEGRAATQADRELETALGVSSLSLFLFEENLS